MEYDRTVLLVGNKQHYKEYVMARFRARMSSVRFPACARMIIIDRVRYVHVCTTQEARGYDSDETTYTYVGPYWPQVESVLLECTHYSPEVSL
jgi:hypothetical protein